MLNKQTTKIIAGIIIFLFLLLISIFIYSKQAVKIFNLPSWSFDNNDIKVEREIKYLRGASTKYIIVANLGTETKKDVKIFESVSNSTAKNASDISFSIKPAIIKQNPPVLRFDIPTIEPGQEIIIQMDFDTGYDDLQKECEAEQEENCDEYFVKKEGGAQESAEKYQERENGNVVVYDYSIEEEGETGGLSQEPEPADTSATLSTGVVEKYEFSETIFPLTIGAENEIMLAEVRNVNISENVCDLYFPNSVLKATYEEPGEIDPTTGDPAFYVTRFYIKVSRYNTNEEARESLEECESYIRDELRIEDFNYLGRQNMGMYPFSVARDEEGAIAGISAVDNFLITITHKGYYEESVYHEIIPDMINKILKQS
ncbi:MAG: hypothetical protein ABH888_03825 [Patescibacteria group bacterium]